MLDIQPADCVKLQGISAPDKLKVNLPLCVKEGFTGAALNKKSYQKGRRRVI
jgi:hypothetical protein